MDAIVGYMFTVVLSIIAAGGFWQFAKQGVPMVQDSAIAQQAAVVNNAAVLYVQDNAAALMAIATPTVPANITIPALACAGYLPASYEAGSGCAAPPYPTAALGIKNAMGQTWLLQVTQPVAGKLQAVVISQGGTAYSLANSGRMRNVSAQIGAAGGFVPYTSQGGDATLVNTNAEGAYGGWNIRPLTTSGYINPGSGHFVSLLSFRNGQSSSTYLYRSQVAGQPQLNTMNTPLIMAAPQSLGSACTESGAIANDGSGNFLMCQQTTTQGMIWANWVSQPVSNLAALPACNAATKNQVATVQNPSVGGLYPSLYSCSGTGWTAIGVDATGNLLVPNTATLKNLVLTGVNTMDAPCPGNGYISVDSNGVLMSCQSGLWSQTGRMVAGAGTACAYPGMIARDASNNLYICN